MLFVGGIVYQIINNQGQVQSISNPQTLQQVQTVQPVQPVQPVQQTGI